jgi:hypothetical protein
MMFVHTVFFYLKPETSAAAREKLLKECHDVLGKIPTVKNLWAGVPANTPRDVVDNSYGVGLTVTFADRAGHDVYQEHPLHLKFIADNKAWWARVQVYDFS